MREVEAKILEIDVERVRETLRVIGAELVFDGVVESVFMRDESDHKLRLRRMGERNFVTHKTPLPSESSKSNDELETDISSIEEMETILVRVGYRAYARSTKHRESYHADGARYELDTIEGVPTYLEAEAESEDALRVAVERLGYSMADTMPLGEGEVKKRYGLSKDTVSYRAGHMDWGLFEDALRLLVARFPTEPQKKPVLFHSIRTASALYALGYGESVCIGGLLHDAIEDTDIAYGEIAERYGAHAAGIVLANSKDPDVPKERLLEDIVLRCVAHSRDALAVKTVEMHDNWGYYRRRLEAGESTESEIGRCETIARLVLRYKPAEWDDQVFGLAREVADSANR